MVAPGKASSRAAARKVKDRWRAKNWYRVLAPDMFESIQIGETLSDDPDKLIGRVLDVTLQQMTGDFSKMHIKLIFKINTVKGSDAYSNFIGHSLTSDYIRRLTRRKRSKTDGVFDVKTKDSFVLRVKPMAVTEKRIQTSQQHAIRMNMNNTISTYATDKLVSEFIREMLSGELASMIFKKCKHIYPIKRIEIRCSEILEIPEHGPEMVVPPKEKPKEKEPPIKAEEVQASEDKAEPAEPMPETEGEEETKKKSKTTKTKKEKEKSKTKKDTEKTKKASTKAEKANENKPE